MTEHCYRIAPASAQQEMDTVFRLRQVAYASSDVDIPAGPLKDRFDDQNNSVSYLLHQDEIPIGTIRASIYSANFGWQAIPAMAYYGNEIRSVFRSETPISQSSFFAIVPTGRSRDWLPKALLFRGLLDVATKHNVGWMVTVVRDRRSQLEFYAKLGFKPIAPPKLYPPVNRTSVLLGTKIEDFAQWVAQHLN